MNLYPLMCFLSRVVLKILFRIRIEGLENVPRKGPFIVAPNHISYIDPIAAGAFIRRSMHYISREDLFDITFLGTLLRICQSFPVRRGKPHLNTIKRALSILNSGEGLLVFPEGTRSVDGKPRKGNPGLGMLASLSGAPVIPTAVIGAEKALPVNARWIRLERVHVRYGKPILPPHANTARDRREAYQVLTDKVMTRIKDLQAEFR